MTIGTRRFLFETAERRGAGIKLACPHRQVGVEPLTVQGENETFNILPMDGQPGVIEELHVEGVESAAH